MRIRQGASRRSGTNLVETTIVLPVTLMFLIGLVVWGMGVSYYQQVAHLARETARFAATHGGQYASENSAAITAKTLPNVNESYLQTSIAAARGTALASSQLTTSVSINTPSGTFDWDATTSNNNRYPTATSNGVTVTNTVSVTVTYQWLPQLYVTGPINLTSTAVEPMAY
jgi:Flp pilus assembly protein TadG